jgi:hypothetical protein
MALDNAESDTYLIILEKMDRAGVETWGPKDNWPDTVDRRSEDRRNKLNSNTRK